ncbi:hypothetical protein [Bacillus sp. RAR_GA_16]|uniref:hypothetical protein n=1 Tax=Bacillus sp. RAR_GA_16 TaxID=2876774 RepID=UPI001CCD3C15|nr:hypothetical protein [Bacillus sp. RAR_GA_16]MCA0173852.1 hypothetical protein [Bacillus sp. RAR_GA_16]
MKLKTILFAIVLLGLVIGLFQSSSFNETVAWIVLGMCGILGVVTFGQPVKNLFKNEKR